MHKRHYDSANTLGKPEYRKSKSRVWNWRHDQIMKMEQQYEQEREAANNQGNFNSLVNTHTSKFKSTSTTSLYFNRTNSGNFINLKRNTDYNSYK